jgi:hypothetical protein
MRCVLFYRVCCSSGWGNSAGSLPFPFRKSGALIGENVATGPLSVVKRQNFNVYWRDNASNEAGFRIFRSQDNVTFTQVATVLPTSFEIAGTPPATLYYDQDPGLLPNTTDYYYVKAYKTAGASVASNTDWTTTAP